MFKKIITFAVVVWLGACDVSFAAAVCSDGCPASVADIETPMKILDRPGLFSVCISAEIIEAAKKSLSGAFPQAGDTPVGSQVLDFERAVANVIYPHPNSINLDRFLLHKIRTMLYRIREQHRLPLFSTTEFASPDACLDAFSAFVTTELSAPTDEARRVGVLSRLEAHAADVRGKLDESFQKYREFYAALAKPFAVFGVVQYLSSLLSLDAEAELSDGALKQLSVLESVGFLKLDAPIEAKKFKTSPRAQVESYIAEKGVPSQIVLGCSHSNHREFLEGFGLPSDVWCGCCDSVPHADAMVVSLHEPTADVLGNLNAPGLWSPIPDLSVESVADETWCVGVYLPETFASIFRVLKAGGLFTTTGHSAELDLKDRLVSLGFEVVEENLSANLLRVRKGVSG